ncbi:MAG: hypothetical protein DRZ82_05040 [Thermoprotei archaeon]|nr:MAG: hypothetical protein DRZ82_05040 [Thermoprotei archaeon]
MGVPSMEIIDIHTHIGIVRSWSPYLKGFVKATIHDLISYMDSVGIDLVALLPLPGIVEPYDRIPGTDKVLKLSKEYPDRIVPFCVIDPRCIKPKERIEQYVKRGCKGFGEYKVRLYIDDERSIRVFKICANLGIPVLIHMDKEFNPDIHRFIKVLNKVPDAIFIMHGPGWWKYISAETGDEDYPKGKVIPGGIIEKIFKEYRNVYADISAHSGLNALKRDKEYASIFLRMFSNRVLFGTDFPCISPEGNQFGPNREHIDLLINLGLEKEILERILYKNALRLLGL